MRLKVLIVTLNLFSFQRWQRSSASRTVKQKNSSMFITLIVSMSVNLLVVFSITSYERIGEILIRDTLSCRSIQPSDYYFFYHEQVTFDVGQVTVVIVFLWTVHFILLCSMFYVLSNFSCSRFSQFNAKKHIVRWLQTFWAVWTYLKDLSGRTVSLLCNSILNYMCCILLVKEDLLWMLKGIS